MNLSGHKTTLQVKESNHYDLRNTIEEMSKEHNVRVTRTDLINVAISEFYNDVHTGNKSIIEVLSKYNLV